MCVGSFFAGVGVTIGTICVGIVIAAIVANIKMNKQTKKHNGGKKNG